MGTAQRDQDSRLGRTPVWLGISSCLLGERVRYNGEHKRASLLVAELTPHVRWVPVCPEVEVGMGVPREPVQLVAGEEGGGEGAPPRLVGAQSRRDWTAAMRAVAATCASRLEELGISGYVFKSRSPSCGLRNVPVLTAAGEPQAAGQGMFAAAIRARFPGLPVADETELGDRSACRAFLARALEYQRNGL